MYIFSEMSEFFTWCQNLLVGVRIYHLVSEYTFQHVQIYVLVSEFITFLCLNIYFNITIII